jgi:seryl-tRNA synthetase
MKAKESADDLLQEKAALERTEKELVEQTAEKKKLLNKKLTTIGNIVHDSVPVSGNEVRTPFLPLNEESKIRLRGRARGPMLTCRAMATQNRTTTRFRRRGPRRA